MDVGSLKHTGCHTCTPQTQHGTWGVPDTLSCQGMGLLPFQWVCNQPKIQVSPLCQYIHCSGWINIHQYNSLKNKHFCEEKLPKINCVVNL